VRWVGHGREKKTAKFYQNPEGKHLLGIRRYTRRWEEYIEMSFKDIEGKGVSWV
jgi:hypothetical protein